MKRLLTCGLLVAALPAFAALQPGAVAPDFRTQASLTGKAFDFRLQDALRKGVVVVYFYPSAFTGGCNVQAHTFAENIERFAAAGASVVGVSLDSIERLNAFSADPQYCAGKLAVASDADGSIAKSYELDIKTVPGIKGTRGAEGLSVSRAWPSDAQWATITRTPASSGTRIKSGLPKASRLAPGTAISSPQCTISGRRARARRRRTTRASAPTRARSTTSSSPAAGRAASCRSGAT